MAHYDYGQDPTLGALIDEVKKLRRQVDSAPHFRWAIVTSTSPLRVRLEEDSVPLLGTPSTLISGLVVGDRVRVELQNNRVTIHGRGSPFQGPSYVNFGNSTSVTAAASSWQYVPVISSIVVNTPVQLLAKLTFAAITNASAGYTMLGVLLSGATSLAEQTLSNGTTEWGQHTPFSMGDSMQVNGFKLVDLNPGVTTIRLRSRRSATGTHAVNYPSMLFEPLR